MINRRSLAFCFASVSAANKICAADFGATVLLQERAHLSSVSLQASSQGGQVAESIVERISKFQSLSETVSQRQASAMEDRSPELRKKLKMQHDETRRLAGTNKALSSEVAGLKESNRQLRDKANEITSGVKVLRNQIEAMKSRVASAEEAMSHVRHSADTALDKAEEVSVLKELAELDAAREQEKKNVEAVKKESFLASGSDTRQLANNPDTPEGALHQLMSTLVRLERRRLGANEQALFDQQMEAEFSVQRALQKQRDELNAMKGSESKLNERLQVAVSHLTTVQEHMHHELDSLIHYSKQGGTVTRRVKKTARGKSAAHRKSLVDSLEKHAAEDANKKNGMLGWVFR